MPGLDREDAYGTHHPKSIVVDGLDTSKICEKPHEYNGITKPGHYKHIDSKTGYPCDPPEYYEGE